MPHGPDGAESQIHMSKRYNFFKGVKFGKKNPKRGNLDENLLNGVISVKIEKAGVKTGIHPFQKFKNDNYRF
jgi:hypothetical protein